MATIFTKIINGDIPSYKIAEDENCYAFLDINPLKAGHTLLVPKSETDYLFDLNNESYQHLFSFAKKVAIALKAKVVCKRIAVVVLGFEVPHAHIHLIPIDNESEIDFANPRVKLSKDEMLSIANDVNKEFLLLS